MLKILKDEEFPSDLILIKSDKITGIIFVDTMNLDGETNLKEKMAPVDTNDLPEESLDKLEGSLTCDSPNEFLDRWDGNVTMESGLPNPGLVFNVGLKGLLMRGCTLRNTDYCIGFVIYTGPESKIMMNAKKSPNKISGV
jgi:magnesium-transporting ATPase (P-type)